MSWVTEGLGHPEWASTTTSWSLAVQPPQPTRRDPPSVEFGARRAGVGRRDGVRRFDRAAQSTKRLAQAPDGSAFATQRREVTIRTSLIASDGLTVVSWEGKLDGGNYAQLPSSHFLPPIDHLHRSGNVLASERFNRGRIVETLSNSLLWMCIDLELTRRVRS
jgi:hypothetical protein